MNGRNDKPAHAASTDELRSALEQTLCCHFGLYRRVDRLERRPSAKRSSFALEELDVQLDDGTALQLMFKNVGAAGLLDGAREVKPAFLNDPLREIETYRAVLTPQLLGSAQCYGSVIDTRAGRYWLFLERVSGCELYDADFTDWQQAARWLARMHIHFANQAEALLKQPHLLHYDCTYYQRWPRRAAAFLRDAEGLAAKRLYRRFQWLAAGYEQVIAQLLSLPLTLTHGEFYASNVLVQRQGSARRICPVDWEMAGVGPGLIDLAALIAGSWTAEEKQALATAYYDMLIADGGRAPSRDAFFVALDYCQLYVAVQWLGWSRGWRPPAEHAQDWLGEALRLADKLGL